MLAFFASLVLPAARAADSTYAGTDTPGQRFEEPESHLTAQLGAAFATGNTQNYTLNTALDGTYRWRLNKLSVSAGANLGRAIVDANGDGHVTDDEREAGWAETARKFWADFRYDRYVATRDSLYLLAGGLVDPFAGYDARAHAQLGYSRLVVGTEKTSLVAEIGADGAREDYVDGVDPNEAYVLSARVMVGLSHALNANVSFDDKFEVYENVLSLADVRVLNQASITAKITNIVSLKLTHSLTFDNVPVEGYEKLDQVTTVTFVASIL